MDFVGCGFVGCGFVGCGFDGFGGFENGNVGLVCLNARLIIVLLVVCGKFEAAVSAVFGTPASLRRERCVVLFNLDKLLAIVSWVSWVCGAVCGAGCG